jgi:hypothetical protein
MLYQPIQRLFDWRTLRSYRFFANDSDLSLRDLCEQSTIAPVISREGDLIRLELGHPGMEADESKCVHGIPRGTRIQVDLDPLHGHLVKRHETLLKTEERECDFRQALEVIEFQSISDGVFFPRGVKYSAASASGDWKTEQAIELKFPTSTNRSKSSDCSSCRTSW